MNQQVVGRRTSPVPLPIATIGEVAKAIGQLQSANTSGIAAEIVRFAQDGTKALDQANRAVINTPEAAGKAADLLRAIRMEMGRQESARKTHTAPLDTFKANLIKLYSVGLDTLNEATTVLKGKSLAFVREEQARRDAEAAVARQAAEAEAARLAAAQAALGDAEGAAQILTDAAALPMGADRVTATGGYGATLGTRVTKKGTVTDNYTFLSSVLELANAGSTPCDDFITALTFSQAQLNNLARAVIDGSIKAIPGLKAEEVSDISVRA